MKPFSFIPFRIAHGKNASQSTGLSWAVITVGFILTISIPHPALASGWTTANQGWSVSSSTWNSVSAFVKLSRKETGLETSILDIVGKAEAPLKGYDSVVLSARIQPKKSPSKMTLAEIQVWVRNSPNQNHAIGRYQFIPETFDRVVRVLKLSPNTVFGSDIQDLMARHLIKEAGVNAYRQNIITANRFMDNLAKIWAGLPLQTGKSAYHNIGQNRATVKRSAVRAAVTGAMLKPPTLLVLKSKGRWSTQKGGWSQNMPH